jgi:hypothetical protein
MSRRPKMDDIDRSPVCGICGKRLPDEKETELILRAREKVGQTELERHAREQGYDFCVSFGLQSHKPESIRDLLESEKGKDGLSYEDWHDKKGAVRGFHVGKRSVGLDPRVARPLWCNDEVATRLVLLLQYPPEQFEEMYELIRKHWRGTAPMQDRRSDMMELRKRGKNVFGENMSLKAQYLKEDASLQDLGDEQILAKLLVGWFYFRKNATDVINESQLTFLQRERHILHWRMWRRLRANTPRRERYRMNRTQPEWVELVEKLRGLMQEARLHPGDYPFVSKLCPFAQPKLESLILRELFWEGTAAGLFSFAYLFYVFRECGREYWRNHEKSKINGLARLSKKQYADMAVATSLVLKSSIIYVLVLDCLVGLSLLLRWHPGIQTSVLIICLMIPVSIWVALLTFAISLSFDGKRIWFRLFTASKLQ